MKRTVTLPFPGTTLSPNARVHWAALAKAKKKSRSTAFVLATNQLGKEGVHRLCAQETINIQLTFHPVARYRYDQDNLLARMKSALDGIADAIGVDDYAFRMHRPSIGDPEQPAVVKVSIW